MKVLYKINYVQRDLYVIEYKNKYLLVYRSSGLNPGRKGRILPFSFLAQPKRPQMYAIPGYIYKEFFYDNSWMNHGKDLSQFGKPCVAFTETLEEFLKDHPTTPTNFDMANARAFIREVATINNSIKEAIKDLEPFDWADL
jgi:hypothetical protein